MVVAVYVPLWEVLAGADGVLAVWLVGTALYRRRGRPRFVLLAPAGRRRRWRR